MKQIHKTFLNYLGEVEPSQPEHKYIPEYLNFKYFKLIDKDLVYKYYYLHQIYHYSFYCGLKIFFKGSKFRWLDIE